MLFKRAIVSTVLLFSSLVVGCRHELKIYKKPLSSKVITIDPRQARDRQDYMLMRNIYGQFIFEDAYGELKPQAVEKWEVSDHGTKYKFKIAKNIKFHSGKILECSDLNFSINFLSQTKSLVSKLFSPVLGYEDFISGKSSRLSGVRCLDTATLEIQLSRKSYVFLSNLADPKVVVLPNNLNNLKDDDFFKKPDGIGPYMTSDNPAGKSHFKFVKNINYFGATSNIDEFSFEVMDKNVAITDFKNNKLMDLEVFQLDSNEVLGLNGVSKIFSSASFANTFLFFNGRKKIFHDIRLRKYLQSLIYQKKFEEVCNRNLFSSSGVIPYGVMGWSDNEKLNDEIKPQNNKNTKISLRLVTYGPPVAECVLKNLKDMLESRGDIDLKIEWKDEMQATGTFVNGDYDLWYDVLSVRGKEPYNLFTFFDNTSSHNITYFNDPKVGNKLIDIESSLGASRNQKYVELSHYIVQDMSYVIPLFSDLRIYVFNKNIKSSGNPAFILGLSTMNQVNL